MECFPRSLFHQEPFILALGPKENFYTISYIEILERLIQEVQDQLSGSRILTQCIRINLSEEKKQKVHPVRALMAHQAQPIVPGPDTADSVAAAK